MLPQYFGRRAGSVQVVALHPHQSVRTSVYHVLASSMGLEETAIMDGAGVFLPLGGICNCEGRRCGVWRRQVCVTRLQAEIDFQTPPWPSISQAAKDCVRQLLNVAPEARPTASKLLQVCPHAIPHAGTLTSCRLCPGYRCCARLMRFLASHTSGVHDLVTCEDMC